MLKAISLRKKYRSKVVVEDVSLEVKRGEVVGLLGPNGAGKSTMMSMLTGIETCDEGDGYINGSSVTWDLETARVHIGLCPQFDAVCSCLLACLLAAACSCHGSRL